MTGPDASITSVTGQSGRWQTYLASATGADHLRAGTLCQDAVLTEAFGQHGGGPFAFAVADGHGHARHFRSSRGSRFAVDSAMAAARQWVANVGRGEHVSQASADRLKADVVARWRAAVAADLAADPVAEPHLAAIQPGDPAEIPYGSTLLLAVVLGNAAVLAQIGDGEMLLISPDGQCRSPVPEDASLDGTQTTSLCQLNAVSAFRTAVVDLTRTHAFAIFAATDGYGNAQAREDWRPSLAADLVRLGAERGTEWLGSQLSDWAGQCASSAGSGDDTSVALAFDTSAALLPRPIQPRSGEHRLPSDPTLPAVAGLVAGDRGQSDQTVLAPGRVPAPPPATPPPATPPPAAGPQDQTVRLPGGPPAATPPPAASPADDRTLGLAGDWQPPAGGTGGARRLPGGRSRLWLVVALIVVIAVVIFLLTQSSGSPAHELGPSPSPTATISVRPSPSHSPHSHGQQSAGSGRHHHKHPKPRHTHGQGNL